MCGIVGYFNAQKQDSTLYSETIHHMLEAIQHRGPDGRGTCLFLNGAFGHVRLAIIDVKGGHQPLSIEQYGVHITYNGEIYNYHEIRQRLISQGVQFKTESDTEVILQLYLNEGASGFHRLRGMFSFAIWDNNQAKLFLLRDALGIKPLFVKHCAQGIIFASEIKGILAAGVDAVLNKEGLHRLLNFRYIPEELTLFEDIVQLAPGELLEWDANTNAVKSKLWLQFRPEINNEDTLACIKDSVAAHLIADVPVGAYLSGGIDSSLIVSIASKDARYLSDGEKMQTFTLDVGDDPNELKNAIRGADLLSVQQTEVASVPLSSEIIDKVVWHTEQPKVNALQSWLVAGGASKEMKVMLSGLGGDELFLGYNLHHLMSSYSSVCTGFPKLAIGTLKRVARFVGGFSCSSLPFSYAERITNIAAEIDNPVKVYGLLRNVWDSPKLRSRLYGPAMLEAPLDDAYSVIENHWAAEKTALDNARYFELSQKMVNDLLWNEDRVSMAHGLEVRVPFVDKALIAHTLGIQSKTLMVKGKKGYLREIIEAELPKEIITRPKSGFQLNATTMFNDFLREGISHQLDSGVFDQYQLFNVEFVKKVVKKPVSKGLGWHYFLLFLMYQTHRWIEQFNVRLR